MQDAVNKTIENEMQELSSRLAGISSRIADDYGPLTDRIRKIVELGEQAQNRDWLKRTATNVPISKKKWWRWMVIALRYDDRIDGAFFDYFGDNSGYINHSSPENAGRFKLRY